jgi:hypothetical protein
MTVLSIVMTLILLFLYFLPTAVALKRKHHQSDAIFVLNLLLGWTLLGWIAAMVWAATSTHKYRPYDDQRALEIDDRRLMENIRRNRQEPRF